MQLSEKARKALAAGLALSTIVWSFSLFAALPFASAAAHSDGCLVNVGGTIWLVSGGVRKGFPTAEVFASHGYNFSQVVAGNSDDSALAQGAVMVYADGTLVKGPSDPLVYLVANGQKRGFVSGSVFTGLGFSFANVVTAATNTFADLPTGANLESATERHTSGVLVNSSGTIYQMTATGRKGIPSMDVFNSNGLSMAKVVTANANDLAAANDGVLTARAACTESGTPVVTGNVNVALASDNPASGTLIAGQGIGDLAHFAFTGSGTVNTLKLKRTGVSADTTLSALYLYDGNVRITDSATVSSGLITFNSSTGLFAVAGTKNISVRSNIAASTSGQTVGVSVDSVTLASGVATGTPAGAVHTIAAAPSNFATASFGGTIDPQGTPTVSAQDDYTMWQNTVTIGNEKVLFKSLKLRQIGSVTASDLGNFRLYVDGTQVGSAVLAVDSEGYVNFDLGSGVLLNTGNRVVKMLGNIIAGANRNMIWSLRQTADAMMIDNQFGQPVLIQAAGTTFSARTSGTVTVDTGTLTFTKRSDSPSGNVVDTGTNITLAKFDVKAAGESMKVESLQISIVESDGESIALNNGALYLDGVQVGSTADINGTNHAAPAYTEYTFGSSFIVVPGTTRVLEIKADISDGDGTDNIEDADTLTARIETGSSNVVRMTSLGSVGRPAADVDGSALSVATGTLAVANNTSYANHSIVVPRQAYKIGSYNIQASTTEGATVTSVVIDFDEVGGVADASDDLTNLYIVMGSYTSPIKATVTDTANTFSTNLVVTAGQTIALDVYADAASSATNGGTDDNAETSATVYYTTALSASSTNATEVDGQTITFLTAGSLTPSLDGGTPLNRIVAGNQEVEAARFKFQAVNDAFTIDEITTSVTSAAISSVVSEVRIYDGATLKGSAPVAQNSNTRALITGLNIPVSSNSSKVLTVKYMLNDVGTGAGTSQSNAAATLYSTKYHDSLGAITTDTTNQPAGNEVYVYKSVPTVSQVDLTNGTIVNGQATDVYKFTVSASASGAVALKQFQLPVSWTDGGGGLDTLELESIKLFEDGVDISGSVVIQDEDGNTVELTSGMVEADGTLTISWLTSNEGVVPAGTTKTYVVRATPQGFNVTDASANSNTDYVALYLAGDSAHNSTKVYVNGTATAATLWGLHTAAAATGSGTNYNFIWSDNSSASHVDTENATSTADWANGYKVLNLDLGGETWSH